jgi:hypothetical protein
MMLKETIRFVYCMGFSIILYTGLFHRIVYYEDGIWKKYLLFNSYSKYEGISSKYI